MERRELSKASNYYFGFSSLMLVSVILLMTSLAAPPSVAVAGKMGDQRMFPPGVLYLT